MDKILLNGRGASGKDTVADYLVSNYGYTKIAFADGIYTIAYDLFGMTSKDRKLLQDIGQKMREIDPSVWVKDTYKRAEQLERVVISDCRQHNEYVEGIEQGYIPIRVSCDVEERIRRLEKRDGFPPDVSLLDNETENGADNGTFIELTNNAEVADLLEKVDSIMQNQDWCKEVAEDIRREFKMNQMY